VYYSWIATTLVPVGLAVALLAARALAQVEITWSPSMIRGSAGAPVTILEFSDYQ
jgi:protein-disulfide isomerase